jgi:hypothetical protein
LVTATTASSPHRKADPRNRSSASADRTTSTASIAVSRGEGAPLDWPAMLDRAETLAAGDPALLAIIADIRDEASRGVASGPIHHLAALAPGQAEERPPMPFRGGEYAEVYVESATGADLNLTVLDAAGRVVCTDTDRSHVAYCGWTPASDGDFTLKVITKGRL